MDRVLQMIFRMVLNRLMRAGISKGVNMASKRGGAQNPPDAPAAPGQQKQIQDRAKSMRRFGRF